MRARARRLFFGLGVFGCAGLAYLLLYRLGVHIPCVFHLVTGLYCPGCGMTRMCVALVRLDFPAAFRANPAILLALPFLAVLFGWSSVVYVKTGRRVVSKGWNILLWALVVLLLVFNVLRNLPGFAYLRPL